MRGRAVVEIGLAIGLACALSACGGRPTSGVRAAATAPSSCGSTVGRCLPLHAAELVVADLVALRARPGLGGLLDAVRPEDVEAFERTFGFSLSEVRRIAYAHYDPGELWVLEGQLDAAAIVSHVGARMNTVELVDASPPRRVGFLGPTRIDIAAVGQGRVAIAHEHGAPMMRMLARLEGHAVPATLERVPPELAIEIEAAPLGALASMPGRLGIDTEAGLLFARTRWMAVTVDEAEEGRLALRLRTSGALPPTAEQNLRAVALSLADSEIGGVFGIREGLPTLAIQTDSLGASMAISLSAQTFASAVRLVMERESVPAGNRATSAHGVHR